MELYFNGKSDSTISFDKPIELSSFQIEIRDVNDNHYDFNNLKHSINIQLEITNQMFDLDNDINDILENDQVENLSDIQSQIDSTSIQDFADLN